MSNSLLTVKVWLKWRSLRHDHLVDVELKSAWLPLLMPLVGLINASEAGIALLLNRVPSPAYDLLDFNLNFYRVVRSRIDEWSNHELRLSISLLIDVHLVKIGTWWIDSHTKRPEIQIFPALVLRPIQMFQFSIVFYMISKSHYLLLFLLLIFFWIVVSSAHRTRLFVCIMLHDFRLFLLRWRW